ncbi:GTP cyclohydrolase 1 type 2 [Sinobacterium norvegicum]|uniref:GTP cyclohydrolase 1 type 2 n=1 Tax=Sinobacterium norvegicum TaxID=1641715 RepID=A0ABN8ELT2_9GAMM|nr:Nif3-like dinuclear metal center hexameric protein [Sinobacterium norvegicum]CAH0993343.1 GTP cyclohydrolase 1 type 2 [Sinobacterium norvegicum]
MAIELSELLAFCDEVLQPQQFSDYAPNGLQVEGANSINRIVFGVTASQALINRAVELGAQAIVVHHGYFWKGENPCITGLKKNRLKVLLANDISLLGYHLPLDSHPVLGNNAQLAQLLGLAVEGGVAGTGSPAIALQGSLAQVCTGEELAASIETKLGRKPLHISAPRPIKRVGWCTGGGQSYIEQAIAAGVDAFITGEVSEQTVHSAREWGVHFYAAGHHATERYGVKAMAEEMAERLDVDTVFVDIDNPA